jgi:O-antigen biosynthesis protein WbqP
LAQISGRDELPIPEKVAYDAKYARELSFVVDWDILKQTVGKVITREGIKEGTANVTVDGERRNVIENLDD